MAQSREFRKDPDAVLDYAVDWSHWLDDDTIDASEWVVPDGIEKDSDTNTTTIATVWLSGGTLGATYTLVNHITTAAGRENDQTITIKVRSN
jgi:hypothetical protein